MINKIFNRLKRPLSRLLLRKIQTYIERGVSFNNSTIFEGNSRISGNTKINGTFIGKGTYIGRDCDLKNANIGRFCSIASDVNVIYGKHPTKLFVSTHPAFYSLGKQAGFTFSKEQLFEDHKLVDGKYNLKIGNDVWIGFGVRILEGVKIGDGAVIGACSLVTKDIEPYTINYGIPARKIGYRFEDDQIDFVRNTKWWNKDFDWLRKNSDKFSSIKTFSEEFRYFDWELKENKVD
jgi:acetyltransferase-like isoleucine patch superfamily enzyme